MTGQDTSSDRAETMRSAQRNAPARVLLCLALAIFACAHWLAAPARAASLAVPVASAARLSGDETRTRFVADLTFAIPYNVYVLANPYRVMIDLPEVDFRLGGKIGSAGANLVRAVRYGRMAPGKARIVLEADGPVLISKSYVLHPKDGLPARLVVDLVRTDEATFNALVSASAPAGAKKKEAEASTIRPLRANDPVPEDMPVVSRAYRRLVERAAKGKKPAPSSIADLLETSPVPFDAGGKARPGHKTRRKPQPAKTKVKKAPPRHGARAAHAARKAGSVRLPLIVIDPGHGGKDPGAAAANGAKEKNLVLAFARQLRARLLATGRYRVQMTRDGDYFLTLRERVKFARQRGASLFISIHADKFGSRSARGAAIYSVSEEASDDEAAALARKENASDIIDGVDLGKGGEEIKGILIDLTMRETKNHSVWLARNLAREMRKATRMRPRAVRSADFRVLRNPEVPSVLIEVGYVSNPSDLRNMRSPLWRKKTAAAMTRAIRRYFASQVAFNR